MKKILITGITGQGNVDGCELEKDMTLFANTYMPIILAEVALRNNMKLVHISSGCIYHYDYARDKPLRETQIPDFIKALKHLIRVDARGIYNVVNKGG